MALRMKPPDPGGFVFLGRCNHLFLTPNRSAVRTRIRPGIIGPYDVDYFDIDSSESKVYYVGQT